MKNSYEEQQRKLEEKVWGPVNVCRLLVLIKMKHEYLSISSHRPKPSQDICPSIYPQYICSVVASLIFVSKLWLYLVCVWCGLSACPCDVAVYGFWSLLSCGWACVWSSEGQWVKSTRRTREQSVIATRRYLSIVRWAWGISYWFTEHFSNDICISL